MSLKSLEGFIEIYLNSTEMIRSAGSVTERRNLAMIRNSSVAMLIENGLSYRISGGYISISTEERDEAFPFMDIFIYMSDSWKERIRYEAELQSYRPMIEAPYEERTEKSVEVFEETEPVEMEETLSERQENTEMQLKDMTYEFSQIKIMDRKTGKSEVMVMIAFPMFNEPSSYIVANLASQDREPAVLCGEELHFPYEDTEIVVRKKDDFSCDITVRDERYFLTREKVKRGGDGGHFVIYDENLELHAYPLSTRAVPEGDIPFIYYMVIDGYSYLSNTKLYEPIFTYRNGTYRMSLRWMKDGEKAILGAVEYKR